MQFIYFIHQMEEMLSLIYILFLRIQLIKLNFLPILVNGYFLIPLIGRKSLVICGYLI